MHMQARSTARIPEENTLDLFNDESHALAMVQKLDSWLLSKDHRSWGVLVFYYVGHGMFHPSTNDFFMAIKDTRPRYLYQSSLQMSCLAVALDAWVRTKCVVMILDCCYAGASKVTLMSSGDQAAHNASKFTAVNGAEPRGLAQLCAAGKDYAAYVLKGAEHTMFTDALMYVLDHGLDEAGPFLSVNELAAGIRDRIQKIHPQEAVDPVVNLSHAQGEWSDSLRVFPNAAYIPQRPRPTVSSQRAGSRDWLEQEEINAAQPVGRRDWFEEEEITAAVVLCDDFNEGREPVQGLGLKQTFYDEAKRYWLVCSRACLYHVTDSLTKRDPFVDWSIDLQVSAERKPRIEVNALLVKKRLQKVLIGGHTTTVSPNLFDSPDVAKSLKRWVKRCVRTFEVLERAGNDKPILQRLQRYLTSGSDVMPEALGSALTFEASSWAACVAMLLVRRERVFHRSRLERAKLHPILNALCARSEESNSHRYWSQLAYLYGASGHGDHDKRIQLLTTAIELRDKTGSSKYRRYEATRASCRIQADSAFSQGRPSDPELISLVLADLHTAQHLLDVRESAANTRDRQRWQALNGIRDEDIATFDPDRSTGLPGKTKITMSRNPNTMRST
jgi:Caspase domain